jgi:fucose permease
MSPFVGGAMFPPIMGCIMDKFGKVSDVYPAIAYKSAFGFCLIAAMIGFLSACLMTEKDGIKGDDSLA